MNNKKMIMIAVAFVLVVALFLTVALITRPQGTAGEKTFTLVVTHRNGEEKSFTITSSREFVAQALLDEGLIEVGGADDGMYNIVDGEYVAWTPEDPFFWCVYINGETAMNGLNTIPIVDGDVYSLVAEEAIW